MVKSFWEIIFEIYEKIMGNREVYFEIKIIKNKNVVDFIMWIDDDGSYIIERMKVFIYDILLMLNKFIK